MVECCRDVMKIVLFFQFICWTPTIVSALETLPTYLDTIPFDTIFAFARMVVELLAIFIYCSYADDITMNVVKIGHLFYDLLWYGMNVRKQKRVIFSKTYQKRSSKRLKAAER